jgi:hypothetical protein
VKAKRNILIIAGNGAVTVGIAESIAAVFGAAPFAGWSAKVISAKDFCPTMLLPANAFFLGCEKPEPPDFAPVKDLFQHINLAGRPCGVFSTQANAVKYLSGLVRDCEASLGEPLLVKDGGTDSRKLKKWVGGIIGDRA